ncbi:class I SAM-dependent DNA methyltransferase [Methanohalophilus portucalensis]|uniref:site-specific DNA-methyltransferase (adenine-specific) n=2 Tax=Methanohalophilus portucalensis TaxID=39664 RepID=A0A1L9C2I7_9EURY|nr:class I SAM-dependent DNA methyltransferase [Methanohalophilus portucalensis]ATU08059.1 DNA methyltransferase [Methanohalophilus portucalensis]OJH48735.1 Type I restriction-modification system, DNA- methyltransferase subunit M [Methanohalophilus portucalensis FDF-1]RNI12219.1 SAM-dependent DNA methyltransferase [Methanohalophilus portucalensis FDF-1]SMH43345.1 type I restriction enzyme M protein [Methanohalophilus portucalensis FDF-1]
MSENTSSIVSKVWSFCNVLRDGGVSYGDYLEQLTYLIFLKMASEYNKPPYNRDIGIPEEYSWEELKQKRGAELDTHYRKLLEEMGKKPGMLGQIFLKAQNKISDPAMLYKVIDMIDKESWVMMGVDTKGEIYEGLLQKNAEDTKSGAGQYFTPRPLIKVMVECLQPEPLKTIGDPCCGTGGFFLAAYDFLKNREERLNREQNRFLKDQTFSGNEIVAGTRRLALMNLFLHNIGEIDGEPMIDNTDALIADAGKRYDYVLTNPPFGKKSSMTFTNDAGELEKQDLTYNRQDFWVTTSNKQLNFLQHIRTMLKAGGQAAVVLPDNVLFEGGVGETVRKKLLETTDLHTILRLPTGIFYANGVKANVLFFEAKKAAKDPWTKEVWIYDYRTNVHHTLKKNPMRYSDLEDFIRCYNPENRFNREETWSEDNPEGRFRRFTYDEIVARDKTNLDIFWLKDESLADLDNLPEPDILANEIVENLESALESFQEIMTTVNVQDEKPDEWESAGNLKIE